MKSRVNKQKHTVPAPLQDGKANSLGQALDNLLKLDIPAKGRIAHHIRMGRVPRALELCKQGQAALWQKAWARGSREIYHQLQLLKHVENLLQWETAPGRLGKTGGAV